MKRLKRQKFLRHLALLALLLAAVAAVAHDTVRGKHGLDAQQALEMRVESLRADLKALQTQRARLEHDAALLGDRAGEQPALLEEQARTLLELAHPSDIIIIDGRTGLR
jgi:cell division protein FtsB